MTDPRPAPYPADTAAKGWRFEIAMEKVRQSDTWSLTLLRGYEPKALLLWMWSVAWEQTPCGSFPNDEALIAARLELPPKVWHKQRDILMRNWWLASDGRLYHDTVTLRVLAMLDKRAGDAARAAARRARIADADASSDGVTAASHVTHGGPKGEFDTKHQAPSTSNSSPPAVKKKKMAPPSPAVSDLVAAGFDEQTATEFIAHKAALKAPLTERAWGDHIHEAQKAGWTPAAAAAKVMAKNWKGFEAKYVANERPPGANGAQPNKQEAIEARNRGVASEWAREHGVPHETA